MLFAISFMNIYILYSHNRAAHGMILSGLVVKILTNQTLHYEPNYK